MRLLIGTIAVGTIAVAITLVPLYKINRPTRDTLSTRTKKKRGCASPTDAHLTYPNQPTRSIRAGSPGTAHPNRPTLHGTSDTCVYAQKAIKTGCQTQFFFSIRRGPCGTDPWAPPCSRSRSRSRSRSPSPARPTARARGEKGPPCPPGGAFSRERTGAGGVARPVWAGVSEGPVRPLRMG